MRTINCGLLAALLMAPMAAAAADRSATPTGRLPTAVSIASTSGPLSAGAAREAKRLAEGVASRRQATAAENRTAHPKGWVGRHPALFGAIVGAGAGALMGATMENELICSGGDEDCLFYGAKRIAVGAGMGASIGALAGIIAGAARHARSR